MSMSPSCITKITATLLLGIKDMTWHKSLDLKTICQNNIWLTLHGNKSTLTQEIYLLLLKIFTKIRIQYFTDTDNIFNQEVFELLTKLSNISFLLVFFFQQMSGITRFDRLCLCLRSHH